MTFLLPSLHTSVTVTVFQPFFLLSREIVLSYNYSLWDPRGGSDNEGMYTREKVKELFQETLIHVLIIILMMGTSGWLKQSLGQKVLGIFQNIPIGDCYSPTELDPSI